MPDTPVRRRALRNPSCPRSAIGRWQAPLAHYRDPLPGAADAATETFLPLTCGGAGPAQVLRRRDMHGGAGPSGRWPLFKARWLKTTRTSPEPTSPRSPHNTCKRFNEILAKSPGDRPLSHFGPRLLLAASFSFLVAPSCGLGMYAVCISTLGLAPFLMQFSDAVLSLPRLR